MKRLCQLGFWAFLFVSGALPGVSLFAQTAEHTPESYPLPSGELKTSFQEIDLFLQKDSFFYSVQPNDTLLKIAKKYGTTIELIKKMNGLAKDIIIPGQKLKIAKAVFSIQIDKSENKLWLYANGELLKTYPVATGRNNSTPIGSFTIENKLENPTWYTTGAVIPPDSPKNMLGTRWLGFSLQSYGIHGTIFPETIGTQDSEGCIRMLNEDVEELYSIVPVKTNVTVVD